MKEKKATRKYKALVAVHERVRRELADELEVAEVTDDIDTLCYMFVGSCGAELGIPKESTVQYTSWLRGQLTDEENLHLIPYMMSWCQTKASIRGTSAQDYAQALYDSMAELLLDMSLDGQMLAEFIDAADSDPSSPEAMLAVATGMPSLLEEHRLEGLSRVLQTENLAAQTLLREA